ncbi:hypothetical protein D3C81_1101310 [compost metagenome]
MFRLDANDAHLRPQVFDVGGDTRDQPAAAHRHEDRLQRPLVLAQDFHGHRALPRDHLRVVERRYKGATGLQGQVQCIGQCKRKAFAVQHRIGAATAHPDDLQLRCRAGHDDGGVDPQFPRGQRHALRMIAGRSRDHADSLLRFAQLHQLVVGAADLEGKGRLQVFALEQDLVAQGFGQGRSRLQRRAHGQFIHRRGKDFFDVAFQQGLLISGKTHGRLLTLIGARETESKNPPRGRVGCCSRELARQMRNGGNNAWLAAQYSGSHDRKLAGH